jgi:hypothetical protein
MDTSRIISLLSIILPFANETAIILTKSGLPAFRGLYRSCLHETILGELTVTSELKKKICRHSDYRNKIIIDLIAYFGIMLFISKNTLMYGYATGVACGVVLLFCSIMLPNMFLSTAIHKVVHIFRIRSPYLYIFVGVVLIAGLVGLTNLLEYEAQKLTKGIKIDPLSEKYTLQ